MNTDTKPYGIHSRDYLRRARHLLDQHSVQTLFYAAFELRCGIEARMHQYLDAQAAVSKKKKRGWKIAKLAKNLNAAFRTGDKIVEFAIMLDGHSEATAFYYTPVRSKLRRMAQRLGDYMHAMQGHPTSKGWWEGMRAYLEQVFEELFQANTGTLLGPPLVSSAGKLDFVHELLPDEDAGDTLAALGKPGTEATIRVRYLDDVPTDD